MKSLHGLFYIDIYSVYSNYSLPLDILPFILLMQINHAQQNLDILTENLTKKRTKYFHFKEKK